MTTVVNPVQKLQEHGREILGIIQDTVAFQVHLPRTECQQHLSTFLDQHRFIVVTGTAGIGKSALAKNALQLLSEDTPVFAFRAEEFACRHIDEALSRIGIHESLRDLSARFPLHARKWLFIDSLERLLEAESFDAFLMFLQRVKDDPSWHVLRTCRSYAVEQARDIFFRV
ncbi:MAG: ATP-binding protein [Deltaproteobacteria bacterium]|nr:ATP-binding protein [Deltaproteobacteria bacterium]